MPLTLVRTTSEENVQILAKESRIIGDKSSRFPAKCVCFNGTNRKRIQKNEWEKENQSIKLINF